jgi:hypothetical protein
MGVVRNICPLAQVERIAKAAVIFITKNMVGQPR